MANDMLFKQAQCKAYLKKVYDGRYIQSHENGNEHEFEYMENGKPYGKECLYECDLDFLKTYYERKEKRFTGFVVGTKEIVATGYLTVNTYDHPYAGEVRVIEKYPEKVYECAIVYYANNKKRYVPLDDIEITEI